MRSLPPSDYYRDRERQIPSLVITGADVNGNLMQPPLEADPEPQEANLPPVVPVILDEALWRHFARFPQVFLLSQS